LQTFVVFAKLRLGQCPVVTWRFFQQAGRVRQKSGLQKLQRELARASFLLRTFLYDCYMLKPNRM